MIAPAPGSTEWNQLITASKVGTILGITPEAWDSPYALWMRMKGLVEAKPQNEAMSRGHYLEPAILAWWRDRHPEFVEWGQQHWFPLGDWAAATPDMNGELDGEAVLVEAKSASDMSEWGEPGTDEIPAYYMAQVHWAMHVSGVGRCYVPVIGPFLRFSEYVVDYDEEVGFLLEARMREFYDSLADNEPPDIDGSDATLAVLRLLHREIEPKAEVEIAPDEAREYVAAVNAEREAIARAKAAKARMLAAMGDANFAMCNGLKVARRQKAGDGAALYQVAKTTEAIDATVQGDAA